MRFDVIFMIGLWAVWALFNCQEMSGQTFSDIASEQGINATVTGNPLGGGMSFYDFDRDGWDDLSFTAANDSCYFYVNNEGVFEQLPSLVYGDGNTKSLLWVDYDNDGDSDLILTAENEPIKLLENDGDFNFSNVTAESGIPFYNVQTNGASFGDYNNDGCLDLYLCAFEVEGDLEDYSRYNHLYEGNCDGTFIDVTLEAGVSNGVKLSFQGAWLDYNKDGWQDLYIINDRQYQNTMYRNNGDGTFTDVSTVSGTGVVIDAMSSTVGDYDNDRDLDIYVTNGPEGNILLQNNGDGTFDNVSDETGVVLDLASWGASWIDHDNNGWLDLYVCTAIFQSWDSILDNRFYANNEAFFTQSNDLFLSDHSKYSFSSAVGDINNDGAMDIAVHNHLETIPFIWLNSGNENNYIKVSVEGVQSNRDGIGTWIEVFCGENVYTRYIMCGQDYLGQSSQHQIAGIGDSEIVDSLQVTWLSGITDTFYDLEPNQNYFVVEGMSVEPEIQVIQEDSSLCIGDTASLQLGDFTVLEWSNGSSSQNIEVTQTGDYWAAVEYNGFTFNSDTVTLNFNPPPSAILNVTDPSCFDGQDGAITMENANGNGIDTAVWIVAQDTLTGNSISGLSSGNYQYNMIDSNGCQLNGLAQLHEPDSLYLNLSIQDELNGDDGSVFLEIYGGTTPYSIQWGDGEFINLDGNSYSESQLSSGEYSVEILDANDCSITEIVEIDFIENIRKAEVGDYGIYPNPVSSDLILTGLKQEAQVKVFNLVGQPLDLSRSKEDDKLTLDFSGQNSGVYFIHIYHAGFESKMVKIIKN